MRDEVRYLYKDTDWHGCGSSVVEVHVTQGLDIPTVYIIAASEAYY